MQGGRMLRTGGIMVIGAPLEGEVPLSLLRDKNIRIRPSVGGGPGFGDRDYEVLNAGYPRSLARWTERENMACFANLLSDRKVQVSPLISDRIPLERAPTAYEKASRGRDAVLGVVMTL
jgi:threonine dehydrogenase-like Zn-dependent dehydrogenase